MSRKRDNNRTIISFFLNSMLLIAIISITGAGYFWISSEYNQFNEEAKSLKTTFIDDQKALIRFEVEKAIDFLNYNQNLTEQRLRENIKDRVYESISIGNNIYQQYNGKMPLARIKQLFKDALRPIRFNNGRGYYFAVSMDGVEQLYPIAPQYENKNLLDLKDEKGNYVIRDEIDVIKKQGEGFVRDYWRKPDAGDEMIYPKITFVKYFEPFDWYFGTGEYLDDVEQDIKRESLERLSQIRFGPNGYIFVNTYDGDALITDGEIVPDKRNLWEMTDPNGIKVIQEERQAVSNPEGDFIEYSWNKMGQEEPEGKISFIKGFPKWEWMVGAGFYINDIQPEIDHLREKIEKRIRVNIIKILVILLILMIAIFIISRTAFNKIRKNFQIFLNFFKKAADESSKIDPGKLTFNEFSLLAESTNEMISKRLKAERDLEQSREHLKLVNKILRHDLTNALASVKSAMRIFSFKPDKSLISEVDKKIDSSIQLIRQMKEFEMISSLHEELEEYDLRVILDELISEFPDLNITVKGEGKVWADQALKSIFNNLIGNAYKHSQSDRLEIRINSGQEKCEIKIIDFGIGIPDKIKNKIFEETFTYGKNGGSGLGLYIVKKALRRYDAEIKVEDNSPHGTVFTVTFRI